VLRGAAESKGDIMKFNFLRGRPIREGSASILIAGREGLELSLRSRNHGGRVSSARAAEE